MRVYNVDSANQALFELTKDALNNPARIYSSSSSVNSTEVNSLGLINLNLLNPLNRFVNIEGRISNIYGIIGECIWVLAGSNRLGEWMPIMVKRALQFSDDGETWRAGYSERLYANGQLETVVQRLKRDPNTRQAMLSIYDPSLDTDAGIAASNGSVFSRDHTCNVFLNFKIENNALNLYLTNRSNDIYWGLLNVNVAEFTLLLEVVAALVGVKVGKYVLVSYDAHLYKLPVIEKQAKAVLENYDSEASLDCDNRDLDLGDIHNTTLLRKFCSEVISACEYSIDAEDLGNKVFKLIKGYNVTGKLADYVKMAAYYFCNHKYDVSIPALSDLESDYLLRLMDNSKFRPSK